MAERGRRGPRLPTSLRVRVTLGAVVVVAIALALGALAFDAALESSLRADAENTAETAAEAVVTAVERDGPEAVTTLEDQVAVLVGADGTVVAESEEVEGADLPVRDDSYETTIDDERYLVISEDLDGGGHVVLASSLEVDQEVRGTVGGLLLVAIPVLVAVVGAVIWLVVGRALAPVSRMRSEVDSIGAGQLDRRVPEPASGDEIGLLARTMNRMLGRLEDSQTAQRRFVSDASHELRSPLATLRQHAELAQSHPEVTSTDELARVVIDEGVRMQQIVEAMLLLARLDEGAPRSSAAVDLDDLAGTEVSRLRATTARNLDIDGSAISAARVSGDERLLGQLVRNLVDNAARHAVGRIAVSVTQDGQTVRLAVDDDGSGVPEDDRERVFERFVRLDEARAREAGGSGLGLAIVRAIARVHGGDVRAEASPWGGARFVVTLPAGS